MFLTTLLETGLFTRDFSIHFWFCLIVCKRLTTKNYSDLSFSHSTVDKICCFNFLAFDRYGKELKTYESLSKKTFQKFLPDFAKKSIAKTYLTSPSIFHKNLRLKNFSSVKNARSQGLSEFCTFFKAKENLLEKKNNPFLSQHLLLFRVERHTL